MSPLKRKIEDRSITALQKVIDDHPTMEGCINKRDKELSWDGYIRLYQNDALASDKTNYDDDVPIQIKGHVDKSLEYMNQNRITAQVDLDDLSNYYRKHGCLYFVMYMNEDGSSVEFFYSSLYPSKIRVYLEKAKNKGNKKSINIPFVKLLPNCDELYLLCKQFSFEVRKQGSGLGQIVPRAITDPNQVKMITATTIGGSSTFDLLKRINTGDTVIYGTIDDSGIEYPLLMQNMVAAIKETRETKVLVGDKQYYSSVEFETTVTSPDVKDYVHEGSMVISPSKNVTITFKKPNINIRFNRVTDLFQIKNDAEFLLDLLEKKEMIIFGKKMPIGNPNVSPEFITHLKGVVEAGRALEDARCTVLIPFSELSDNDKKEIDLLTAIWNGEVGFNTDKTSFLYFWKFHNKLWPILIEKSQEKTRIMGYVFNTGVVFSVGNPRGNKDLERLPDDAFIVPNFLYLEPEVLSNLYYYDYESMYEQIDRTVYNEETAGDLNGLALNFITAYDLSDNEKLLGLSESILRKLMDIFPNEVQYPINLGQIEVRRDGKLSNESRDRLEKIRKTIEELPIMDESTRASISRTYEYCYAVLKKDIVLADERYDSLTEIDKGGIDDWPIRSLHLQLKSIKNSLM